MRAAGLAAGLGATESPDPKPGLFDSGRFLSRKT